MKVHESGNVEIGSVFDRDSGERLAVCDFCKKVLFNRSSSLGVVRSWNQCSLDSGHCDSHGRRLKFKPCLGGVRVIWVCFKLVGLPDVES